MSLDWIDLGLVFDVNKLIDLPEWYFSHAQAPNAVVMEDFVRIYFTAREKPSKDGNATSRAMYVDMDPSKNFKILAMSENPILELGGLGSFDEHGTYPFTVLKREKDFVAIYGGWSRSKSVPFDISLGLATSQDGVRFERFADGPILSPGLNEPFVITSPKLRRFENRYFLTYTAGTTWINSQGRMEIVYKLRSATSDDLLNWERDGANIIEDKLNSMEAQACGDIFESENKFHMFFCYREALDFRVNIDNSYRIGYAVSRDLITWQRRDDFVGISPTPNSWDSMMCAYPNIFNFKGQIYVLYLGNETGKYGFGAKQLIGILS